MRHTLEQLKAMSNAELFQMWSGGEYPFDRSECGHCLTQHAAGCCLEHTDILPWSLADPFMLNEHLEELYALRLFYDHLYPQPTVEETHADVLAKAIERQKEHIEENELEWRADLVRGEEE